MSESNVKMRRSQFTEKALKNKGFTLLELLAVIVILAVISLIAVPLILNLIDRFKTNSFKETARQIYAAGERYLTVQLKGKKDKCVYFDFSKNYSLETVIDNKTYIPLKELNLKGKLPISGILTICNGEVSLEVSNGYITVKIDKDKNIEIITGTGNSNVSGIIPDASYKGKWVNYTPDYATWDTARDGVETTEVKTQGNFNIYDKKLDKAVTGQSKNNSITCYNSNYVNKYSGWVIMDVAKDGTMTLLHAGTPECYYHSGSSSVYASKSASILATTSTSSNPGTGKAWLKYGNASFAQSVHYLDGEDFKLISGISDYSGCDNNACYDNSTVNIGSYYWLASQYSAYDLYNWTANARSVSHSGGYSNGVRPVVVLKSGVKIGTKGSGTEADPYQLVSELESISVSPSNISIGVNEIITIKVTPSPIVAKVDMQYKSNDTSIATVDSNGKVTGVKLGTTTIKVSDKITGKSVSIPVSVTSTPGITPDASYKGKWVNYTPDYATWDTARDGVETTEVKTQGNFNIYDKKLDKAVTGQSKNNSITCYNSNYVNKYSGWVIMDVAKDGTMTLLHAGTPECYYHSGSSSVYASKSASILATTSTSSNPGTGKAWLKYGNASFAQSVHYLDGEDFKLISGISDYSGCDNNACYDNSTVNIGSYYWLASQYSAYDLYNWTANARSVSHSGGYSNGVRPVVVLKSGVKIGTKGSGTEADPYQLVSELESISVSPSNISIGVNEIITIKVTPSPIVAKVDMQYKSNDTSIATVDSNGKVTGVKLGTTTIKVSDKITGKSVSIPVSVTSTPGITPDASYKGKWVNYTPDYATWDTARDGVETTEVKTQGNFNIYDKKLDKAVTGQSKNNSITCYNSNYVNKYSGWVIMDVAKDGTMTLLHAGTPECYYHSGSSSVYASKSASILATTSTSSSPGTGKAWLKYGNASFAQSVHYLDGEDFKLISGISDYSGCDNNACYDNSTVNIGSYYWLASQYSAYDLYNWTANVRSVSHSGGYSNGVRPVVVLKSGVKIGTKGSGTEADPYQLVSELESISVSPSNISIGVNEIITIKVTPSPIVAKVDMQYKSNDTSIATVDSNGKVTGVKLGTTTIKVSDKITGKSVSIPVSVTSTPGITPDASYKGKWVNYTPDYATWDTARDGVETTEVKTQGNFNIYDKKLDKAVTGQSKNNSITCYNSNYVNKYSGWVIMDVAKDGTMTLLHAGTPECYYHSGSSSIYASKSESILATISTSSNPGTGKAWLKYGNASFAQSVHYLDGEDFKLISRISDYSGCDNNACYDNSTVNIGSYYWLASQYSAYDLYNWTANARSVSHSGGYSFGVRPVIKLKPGIKIGTKGTGTEADPYQLVS